jgi:hypothetical protein
MSPGREVGCAAVVVYCSDYGSAEGRSGILEESCISAYKCMYLLEEFAWGFACLSVKGLQVPPECLPPTLLARILPPFFVLLSCSLQLIYHTLAAHLCRLLLTEGTGIGPAPTQYTDQNLGPSISGFSHVPSHLSCAQRLHCTPRNEQTPLDSPHGNSQRRHYNVTVPKLLAQGTLHTGPVLPSQRRQLDPAQCNVGVLVAWRRHKVGDDPLLELEAHGNTPRS